MCRFRPRVVHYPRLQVWKWLQLPLLYWGPFPFHSWCPPQPNPNPTLDVQLLLPGIKVSYCQEYHAVHLVRVTGSFYTQRDRNVLLVRRLHPSLGWTQRRCKMSVWDVEREAGRISLPFSTDTELFFARERRLARVGLKLE
jgi:hypothetical protein